MKVADRIRLELPLGWFITVSLRQAVDAVPLQAAVQRRTREMWNSGLEGIEAIIERSSVCLRKATISASSSLLSIVERGSLGPIRASQTETRRRHLATVLGLIPQRTASSL